VIPAARPPASARRPSGEFELSPWRGAEEPRGSPFRGRRTPQRSSSPPVVAPDSACRAGGHRFDRGPVAEETQKCCLFRQRRCERCASTAQSNRVEQRSMRGANLAQPCRFCRSLSGDVLCRDGWCERGASGPGGSPPAVRFGSRPEMMAGFLRAVAPPGGAPLVRARQLAHGLPWVASVFQEHLAAFCEVAQMLIARLPHPSARRLPDARLVVSIVNTSRDQHGAQISS
jgi:hypothetical protein